MNNYICCAAITLAILVVGSVQVSEYRIYFVKKISDIFAVLFCEDVHVKHKK